MIFMSLANPITLHNDDQKSRFT